MNAIDSLSSLRIPQLTTGVLTDTELLLGGTVQGKRILQAYLLPQEARTLSGLLEYLWQQDVMVVWVLPGSQFSRRVTSEELMQQDSRWTCLLHSAQDQPERPACVLFLPHGQRQRLTLSFPEHAGWNWRLADATSLLATVTYLDQLLSHHLVETPQQSAHQLLTELTLHEPVAQFRASPDDLETLLRHPEGPLPLPQGRAELAWMRPLTREEQRLRYLHKYTHVSRTLRAALDVPLGSGAPLLSPGGRACDGNRPGLWWVQLERAGSLFDGKLLPGLLPDGQGWMSTPQVLCCRALGYRVQVQQGYYWPQSQQLLKPWAAFLWRAAEQLHTQTQHFRHAQARANASASIQQLAEHALALLDKSEESGGWARPDWRAHLRGRRQALLFADLVQLVRRGTMPALVYEDAFWTVSADPNPLTAVPGLLSRQHWNGFALGYEVPLSLSKEVQALFRGSMPVDQVITRLESLA